MHNEVITRFLNISGKFNTYQLSSWVFVGLCWHQRPIACGRRPWGKLHREFLYSSISGILTIPVKGWMLVSTLMSLKFAGLTDFPFFAIVKESPNLTLGVIILTKCNINLRKKKRPACENTTLRYVSTKTQISNTLYW